MKKNKYLWVFLVIGLLFIIDPVYAGPGGAIAKGIFKTWWGKILGLILFILLFPIIAYTYIVEFLKVRKTKKQLLEASFKNNDFSWLNLENHFSNIITRVYDAWEKSDMSQVKNFVNNWYWQNQQLIHLNRWEEKNLKNICSLQSISSIKPLYIELSGKENYEGSKIVIKITGYIEDYLIEKESKRVIEGKKGFQDETHIWVMEYIDGKWLLDNIKNESYSLSYLKLNNIVPETITA